MQGHLGPVTVHTAGQCDCASFMYPVVEEAHLPNLLPAGPGRRVNRWLGHGPVWRSSQARVGGSSGNTEKDLGEIRGYFLEEVTAELILEV